jgi:hypothetical protein
MTTVLNSLIASARPALRRMSYAMRALGRASWAIAKPILRLTFQIVLALIIVFEEWGWQPLANLLARIAHLKPIAAFEAWVGRLPPYGALAVFALPTILLLPLKFLALFLIATGHKIAAALLFLGAKVFGTAIVARLFQVTHDQLMQIGWFRAAYARLMPIKDALVERVRQSAVWKQARVIKHHAKRALGPLNRLLRQQVTSLLAFWRGGRDG